MEEFSPSFPKRKTSNIGFMGRKAIEVREAVEPFLALTMLFLVFILVNRTFSVRFTRMKILYGRARYLGSESHFGEESG